MIEAGSGDLLDADVEALVNTVNTVGVMGNETVPNGTSPDHWPCWTPSM